MNEITTIISDIHLGSDNCQAKALTKFLENIEERSNRLILNGDMFDSMDFRRLKKHHWHVLSKLRKISDKIEVVWVVGNHDGTAEVISHLLGITAVDEYEFQSGDKKILVLHGHIFDDFLDDHPILTHIGDLIYWLLQKIDGSHTIARMAKHSSKHYLRCAEDIKKKAIKYAETKECQIVCCGHTHNGEADVAYFNSGCWTEKPCTFLEVNFGNVKLLNFTSYDQPSDTNCEEILLVS